MRTSRRNAEPERRSKVPLVAGVLVVLMLALVALKFSSGSSGPPRINSDVKGSSEAAVMFNEAKQLVRQGKWAAAKAKLEAVREEDEEYEPRQVENYLKVAAEELPNEERFATATDALAKNELGRAATALAQVKTTTQDRLLTEARQALAQKIEARRSEARSLLATSQWPALLALSDDLLVAVPGDRDASEWKQQAEQAIARGKRGPVKVVSTETPWLDAQQRFRSGDVSGARALAQGCTKQHAKCRDFENGLAVLEAKTERLESLSDTDLLTVFKLDRELAGGPSSDTSKPLRARLASRYTLKASGAKSSGAWGKAYEYARVALDAEPANTAAQAILTEAKTVSGELFLRAYQQRETDPAEAVKLFKEVVAMTPADDQNHIKSKGFIERLEPR